MGQRDLWRGLGVNWSGRYLGLRAMISMCCIHVWKLFKKTSVTNKNCAHLPLFLYKTELRGSPWTLDRTRLRVSKGTERERKREMCFNTIVLPTYNLATEGYGNIQKQLKFRHHFRCCSISHHHLQQSKQNRTSMKLGKVSEINTSLPPPATTTARKWQKRSHKRNLLFPTVLRKKENAFAFK